MGCAGSKLPDDPPNGDAKKTEVPNSSAAPPAAVAGESTTADGAQSARKSATLDEARIGPVRALFESFDIDGTRKLELAEFKKASMKVGPQEHQLLTQLDAMDYDRDGFIDQEEWEKWFTVCAGELNEEEFKVVMEDMTSAADNMLAVIRCTRMAAEAAQTPEPETDTPADAPLEGAQLAAVEALFKAFDFEGKGGIDRAKVSEAAVTFGPHKSHIFSQLEQMDTNGDNIITLAEMKVFFQVAGAKLDKDQFDAIIADMQEVASEAATIAGLLQQAQEAPTAPLEEDKSEAPSLSPPRTELLNKLFGLFSESADGYINVAALDGCTMEEGPHKTKLLSNLKEMDENNDGQLTLQEMTTYFAAVGVQMTDEEFELILNEMIDFCSTHQLAAQLAALASSV